MLTQKHSILPYLTLPFSLTPLIKAIELNHIEIVELLLKHLKIDVNAETFHLTLPLSSTPFIKAVGRNHIEIVDLLLKHPRIDLNKGTNCASTPIRHASMHRPMLVTLKTS
jgi:ankyrin repeat protein